MKCSFNHWRYDNNVLFVLFFSPKLKKAEAWYGEWTLQKGKHIVTNPMYYGLIDRAFGNDDEVMAFLKSPPPFSYSFDYLYSPKMMASHDDG